MSKFKVGNEVVMYDHTRGVVVLHDPKEEYPYLVWNSEIDETEWCSEEALQLLNPLQTVYAVCDADGEIKYASIANTEEDCLTNWRYMIGKLHDYNYKLPSTYSIRPFALNPINEEV